MSNTQSNQPKVERRKVGSCNGRSQSCSGFRHSCVQGFKHCSEGSEPLSTSNSLLFVGQTRWPSGAPDSALLGLSRKQQSSSIAVAENSWEGLISWLGFASALPITATQGMGNSDWIIIVIIITSVWTAHCNLQSPLQSIFIYSISFGPYHSPGR